MIKTFFENSRKIAKIISIFLSALSIVIATIVVLFGIVSRTFLNKPFVGVEDLAILCLSWVVFFGALLLFIEKGHIKVDFFQNRLPLTYKKLVLFIFNIITVYFLWIVVKNYPEYVYKNQIRFTAPALEIKKVYFSIPVFISFSSMLLFAIEDTYYSFTDLFLKEHPL